ncbi:hypothetical protein NM74_09950 [Aeromonas hydrophila]|uniref:phage tail-collar fiber domain-containing protein n=1 Tax=Aeromonas hydrophila TaxID=644 RepID=UPI000538E4E4|nr:phage tail protein [Aeromonas hydrophila]KHA56851.1 hypothetical protein NM74_09950 [Aeromonas hydrophila]
MSQVITNAFASYWQACLTDELPVVLDAFVLANIPGLDPDGEISPDDGLPPAAQIVHRQAVDQRGRINLDAVAYTIVMDTSVGDFEFNAMYLINTESNLVGMIVHKGLEAKLKTDEASGQTGNSLVKSMLMEYDRASLATVTTVDAGTWQIDYAARLAGMDEDMRRLTLPLYGPAWFEGDGFLVTNNAGVYHVSPGNAAIGGLLAVQPEDEIVTPDALPMGVWVDVHRAGSVTGAWKNHVSLVLSAEDLIDYTDDGGYQHHVAKLAIVNADSNVTDTRRQRTHDHHWDEILDPPPPPTPEDIGAAPVDHTPPGTLTNPIPLAKEDLNTIITPSVYRQDSDANAAVELNYPEPKAGSLTVTAGAGVQHRYHVYNTSRVYTRAQYNEGAFTPWARDYNTQNKPTLDEIGAAAANHTHDWGQVGAPQRVAGDHGEIIPPGEYAQLLSQSGFFNNNGGLGAYGDPFPGQWAYFFHNSHSNPAGFCGSFAMNFGGTQLRYGAISAGAATGWKTIFTQDEPPQVGHIPGLQDALNGKSNNGHHHSAIEGNWDIISDSWGQIGTYAFAGRFDSGGQLSPGDVIAGTSIRLCNGEGVLVGVSPPGTWKCLGYVKGDRDYGVWNVTLFIRIV